LCPAPFSIALLNTSQMQARHRWTRLLTDEVQQVDLDSSELHNAVMTLASIPATYLNAVFPY
jgi:hypothetical protein